MTRHPYFMPMTIVGPDDWRRDALCRGHHNPDMWFPTTRYANQVTVDKAKAICDWCPVKALCAETYAREPYGIFGGQTAAERAKARGGREVKDPGDEEPPKCGTTGGYYMHRTLEQPPCDACKAARRAHEREADQNRRDRRKANAEAKLEASA